MFLAEFHYSQYGKSKQASYRDCEFASIIGGIPLKPDPLERCSAVCKCEHFVTWVNGPSQVPTSLLPLSKSLKVSLSVSSLVLPMATIKSKKGSRPARDPGEPS